MPQPRDLRLYASVKRQVYAQHPQHSAYRSGLLVQAYKREYQKKYGTGNPYIGKKSPRKTSGLSRWFAEEWRNPRGEVGYRYKSDVYRPTRRITSRTPLTFSELSASEIRRARRTKSRTRRVSRFRKNY